MFTRFLFIFIRNLDTLVAWSISDDGKIFGVLFVFRSKKCFSGY